MSELLGRDNSMVFIHLSSPEIYPIQTQYNQSADILFFLLPAYPLENNYNYKLHAALNSEY